MPTKSIDKVLAAPFVAPVFSGNLRQWTQDLAREIEIRMKEYGNAINQGVDADEDSRYSFLLGQQDTVNGREDQDRRLFALVDKSDPRRDDEALRRGALGL